jgi:hypothetical protein
LEASTERRRDSNQHGDIIRDSGVGCFGDGNSDDPSSSITVIPRWLSGDFWLGSLADPSEASCLEPQAFFMLTHVKMTFW